MQINLAGRVAVVTGGANGIGQATALAFARAGAAVEIWDMAAAAGQRLVDEIAAADGRAAFHAVNVADQAAVEAAAAAARQRWGRLDILINNAGITRDAQLVKVKDGSVVARMEEADFDRVIAVNLKGAYNCARAVVPDMVAGRWGRILTAASVVGLYGNFGQTNYAASKAGVIGMTQVWARELGRRGITANAVAPGFIATDMAQAVPEKVLAGMVDRTPVGRLGTPAEVAALYLFLASEQAAFINGAVISIDGGLVLGT